MKTKLNMLIGITTSLLISAGLASAADKISATNESTTEVKPLGSEFGEEPALPCVSCHCGEHDNDRTFN